MPSQAKHNDPFDSLDDLDDEFVTDYRPNSMRTTTT